MSDDQQQTHPFWWIITNDRPRDQQGASHGRNENSHVEPTSRPNRKMVEICPGTWTHLRGTAETRECISRDFYIPTSCSSCSSEMFCIQDVEYVLCPSCRVVNPMEEGIYTSYCEGGLGLGFTLEDLRINLELLLTEQDKTS